MFFKRPKLPPPTGKIEVFCRHCNVSSISQHKKRLSSFSHEACYHNLLDTIDLEKAKLTFFLDGTLSSHFLSAEKNHPIIEINAGSEATSFLYLLDHIASLSLSPNTLIYFVEDDYLHRPGWTKILLEAFSIDGVDYATLYDHRDKYFFPQYRNLTSQLYLTASSHWRTIPSTTQTFATRFATLLHDLPIHRRYSKNRTISADHDKFCHLTKKGARLISPIPGFSTHAEPEYASPLIDWESLTRSSLCTK